MVDEVDPRAPRFGQAVTAVLAVGGVVLREPALVSVLALVLVVPVLSRWRVDPYGLVWRRGVRRALGPPRTTESAIPHRFARVVGAVFTSAAALLLVVSLAGGPEPVAFAAYSLVAVVGGLAALSATTGVCVGCRMYRQVGLFRNLGLLTSPAPDR